jgi:hypothetical protein
MMTSRIDEGVLHVGSYLSGCLGLLAQLPGRSAMCGSCVGQEVVHLTGRGGGGGGLHCANGAV